MYDRQKVVRERRASSRSGISASVIEDVPLEARNTSVSNLHVSRTKVSIYYVEYLPHYIVVKSVKQRHCWREDHSIRMAVYWKDQKSRSGRSSPGLGCRI